MSKTGISYLDKTWNPVVGCTAAGAECLHCWARELHERRHKAVKDGRRMPVQYARPFSTIQALNWRFDEPRRWKKRQRVGVCFGGDLFHEDVPDQTIAEVWRTMFKVPQHAYFILTKRADRMVALVPRLAATFGVLSNVWLGVSAGNQPRANERLPSLVRLGEAGWHIWISVEPLLETIDISPWLYSGYTEPPQTDRIGWIVVGGESGKNARPCDLAWIRGIVRQGKAAHVRTYVKQLGSAAFDSTVPHWYRPLKRLAGMHNRAGADPSEWPEDVRVRDSPEAQA